MYRTLTAKSLVLFVLLLTLFVPPKLFGLVHAQENQTTQIEQITYEAVVKNVLEESKNPNGGYY